MKFLLLIFVLVGCATQQPEVFRLSTGELVTCQRYAQRDCGLNIMECGEEQSVEFDCLQNVQYVGKVGTKPVSMDPLPKKKPCEGKDGKPTCPPDYAEPEVSK